MAAQFKFRRSQLFRVFKLYHTLEATAALSSFGMITFFYGVIKLTPLLWTSAKHTTARTFKFSFLTLYKMRFFFYMYAGEGKSE